jgi:hypothetical protein
MFFDWCNYLREAGNNLPDLDKIDGLFYFSLLYKIKSIHPIEIQKHNA